MCDGHGRIAATAFVHQKKRHRLSDDHRASKDDDVRPGCFDAALDEQALAAERCAGDERVGIAHRDLGDVHGVKAVHVLARVECFDDGAFVNVLRRRRLHEDAVNSRVGVEAVDFGE